MSNLWKAHWSWLQMQMWFTHWMLVPTSVVGVDSQGSQNHCDLLWWNAHDGGKPALQYVYRAASAHLLSSHETYILWLMSAPWKEVIAAAKVQNLTVNLGQHSKARSRRLYSVLASAWDKLIDWSQTVWVYSYDLICQALIRSWALSSNQRQCQPKGYTNLPPRCQEGIWS